MSDEHIKHEKVGPGMSISFGYKDMDEMFADMAKAEDAANARILPQQHAMINCQTDQYFVNIDTLIDGLFIAGEAWSLERANRSELEAYNAKSESELSKEDLAAYRDGCRMLKDSRKRGYIFGNAFSEICPEGELGSTHVSSMWPLSERAFNEAKEQHWQPDLKSDAKSPELRITLFDLYIKHAVK
jgi:hypothetical protein